FFRDPVRVRAYEPGDFCSPADGRVTEITELDHHEAIDGPAVRIGIFLSIFNVHINRAPCSGRVRALAYRAGEFLDARHPESGRRNESNTVLIDPDEPLPGPVEVRQVAGTVARRIICHLATDQHVPIGARFGMIKFGSRTELIIPRLESTEVKVEVGDRVRAGLTILARQAVRAPSAVVPAPCECAEA
ncbi:MAG: phosphatidylserine decarboxylase, partial [Planctomycetes bacterium]|nr:phosphatidylserine decarboxylase [Planctomycetota bacterium]